MPRELFFDHALLPVGWARDVRIGVADGAIVVGRAQARRATGAERLAGIALPGLPNLHCHAFQRGMAGLAERRGPQADSFWTWREVMYRFLARLTPDDVEAIAAFAYVEMLEAGFTTVGEFHYLHHDVDGRPYADIGEMAARIAAASAETRIGLTLLPSFYAYGGFGGAPPSPGQRRFLNDPDRFLKLVERCRAIVAGLPAARVGIAPHSLRAVTPETLRAVCQAAPDGPIHIHAAEQTKEVDECVAALGSRPVQWLIDHAGLDARWCVIHATHTTRAGNPRAGGVRRRGRALPAHRGVARRRHFRRRQLSRRRRALRDRHRLQYPDRCRRRAAATGIRPAPGAALPQRHDRAGGGIDRAPAVRRRACRRRAGAARPIGALAASLACRHRAARRPAIRISPRAATTNGSTPGSSWPAARR